jgi:hypothetical protein
MSIIIPTSMGTAAAAFGYNSGYATIPAMNIDDLPGGGLSKASVNYTTGSGNHDLISSAANTGGVTIMSNGLRFKTTHPSQYSYVSLLGQTGAGSVAFNYVWGYSSYMRDLLLGCAFPIYLPAGRYVRVSSTGAGVSAVAQAFVTYITGQLPNAVHIDDLQTSWGTSYLGAGSSPGGRLILAALTDRYYGSSVSPFSSGPTALGEPLLPNNYSLWGAYDETNGRIPAIYLPNGTTRTIYAYGFIYLDIP